MLPLISQVLSLGYTASQVLKFLSGKFKNMNSGIKSAQSQGYSDEDILKFLSGKIKSKGKDQQLSANEQYLKRQGFKTKEERKESQNKFIQGAFQLGGSALGAYALNRSLPRSSSIKGQLLPAQSNSPIGPSGQLPAPQQTINITPQLPNQPPQAQIPQQHPVQPPQKPIAPLAPQAPISPSVPVKSVNAPIKKVAPLPPKLQKVISNVASSGNDIDQIEGYLQKFHPKEVKAYENNAKAPIRTAIEDFVNSNPPAQPKQPAVQPSAGQVEAPRAEQERVGDNIEQPSSERFKDLIESGKKKFEEHYYPEKKKGSTVALPNGEIGEITDIRQGIATVNSNGKEYRRKIDELIDSPLPEKDLADLHDDLLRGIQSETGQEISRMVSFAGYDPNTNELAFLPHIGPLYVFDDISSEDKEELTNILAQRKTSGENFIGAWKEGSQSPIGAKMSQLIQRLQKERGGKGNEYKGKFEKIYDALEPGKVASKEKNREKKAEESRLKKEEKKKELPYKPEKKSKREKLDEIQSDHISPKVQEKSKEEILDEFEKKIKKSTNMEDLLKLISERDEFLGKKTKKVQKENLQENPEEFAKTKYLEREIPEGWYVHGKVGKQTINVNKAIQLSKDWDVADQYSGKNGSRWMMRPYKRSKVLDLSDENSKDMDKIVKKAISDWKRGRLKDILEDIEGSLGREAEEKDIEESFRQSFAPKDIVDSAQAYDNQSFIEWLSDNFSPDFIKTPNGAVVLSPENVEKIKVPI